MAARQIRTKEAFVQISKDGVRLGTSMLKILDFKFDPEVDIKKTRYSGEKRDTADLDIKGVNFSFKTNAVDHAWFDLWNEIQTADEAGIDGPDISLAVTYAYRNGRDESLVLHGDLVLKLDSQEHPNDDYVAQSWTGYCKFSDGV